MLHLLYGQSEVISAGKNLTGRVVEITQGAARDSERPATA